MKTGKIRQARGARSGRAIKALTHDILGNGARRPVQPKWAWHFRTLAELRERLLRDRGAQLAGALEQIEPHSMDVADSATDEFDHDLALTELSANQDAIYEVDQALDRILNGTYGRCEESGERIPAARLRAIPWTRFAKSVQDRLEKKGIAGPARLGKLRSLREAEAAALPETPSELEEKEAQLERPKKLIEEAITHPAPARNNEVSEEQ